MTGAAQPALPSWLRDAEWAQPKAVLARTTLVLQSCWYILAGFLPFYTILFSTLHITLTSTDRQFSFPCSIFSTHQCTTADWCQTFLTSQADNGVGTNPGGGWQQLHWGCNIGQHTGTYHIQAVSMNGETVRRQTKRYAESSILIINANKLKQLGRKLMISVHSNYIYSRWTSLSGNSW